MLLRNFGSCNCSLQWLASSLWSKLLICKNKFNILFADKFSYIFIQKLISALDGLIGHCC